MRRLIIVLVGLIAIAGLVVAERAHRGVHQSSTANQTAGNGAPSIAADVPLPMECQVPPRSLASLVALAGTPVAGSPTASPTPAPASGSPADPATTGEIVASVRKVVACSNAGDYPRTFALYTDDHVHRLLAAAAARTGLRPDAIPIALATPRAIAPRQWQAIRAIGSVQLLPGGRVGALVVTVPTAQPSAETVREWIFARHDDAWLVADMIDLGAATPAP